MNDLTQHHLVQSLRGNITIAALLCSGAFSLCTPALAQIQGDEFPMARVPEAFRPEPIKINSFLVVPVIDVETDFVDNVFASDAFDVNDVILSVTPRLFMRNSRDDRNVFMSVSGGYETYLDNSRPGRAVFDVNGAARFGIGTRTRTFVGGNFQSNDTQGFAVVDGDDRAGQPLNLTAVSVRAGGEQDFGLLKVAVEGDYRDVSYSGDVVVDDVEVESGFKDFDTLSGTARLTYALSPGQGVYLQGKARMINFDSLGNGIQLPGLVEADLSSEDLSFQIGYRREITRLLELDLSAGYITQNYDSAAFKNVNSFAFNAKLLWEPTRLTSVRLRGGRTLDTSNDPFLTGFLRTTASLTVSHELRRNIVLDGNVRFSDLAAVDGSSNGQQFGTYASVRYYLNRDWSVRLRGEYLDRDTAEFPGSQTRATVGLRYNF